VRLERQPDQVVTIRAKPRDPYRAAKGHARGDGGITELIERLLDEFQHALR
jgi:hypothetical protein